MGITMMTKTGALAATSDHGDADSLAELLPTERQIEHFLAGNTDGRALFHALYDHILDEPVPPRLTKVLRSS
jgi:hypothetical protein